VPRWYFARIALVIADPVRPGLAAASSAVFGTAAGVPGCATFGISVTVTETVRWAPLRHSRMGRDWPIGVMAIIRASARVSANCSPPTSRMMSPTCTIPCAGPGAATSVTMAPRTSDRPAAAANAGVIGCRCTPI